jgi:hypothetical protein
VTQAQAHISLESNNSFVDLSGAVDLSLFPGCQIQIKDASNKVLTGYISAQGTAYSYDSDVALNGNFAATGAGVFDNDPTSWTVVNEVDTNRRITADGSTATIYMTAASGALYMKQGTISSGPLWHVAFDVTSISGTMQVLCAGAGTTPSGMSNITATGSYAGYFTGEEAYIYFSKVVGSSTAVNAAIDNVVVRKVTAPSTNGVRIVSASNGASYNWTSEDSGFKRNGSAGYTYTIYPASASVTISDTSTYSYGLVDCADVPGMIGIDVTGAATIINYTVVRCPCGGIQANENMTLKNSIVSSAGNDILIASGKTVSGTTNIFVDSAKAGSGTYTNVSGTQWSQALSFLGTADFHLSSTATNCINRGTPVGLTSDIVGHPIFGNPDLGAYEAGGYLLLW